MNKSKKHKRFTELIQPISGQVKAYVRNLAWNPNDAEDIFQTAMLNAYQKFDVYTDGTNFKAWFFKFLTFAAYNMNRKHSKISSNEVLAEAEFIANQPELEVFNESKEYDEVLNNTDEILDSFAEEVQEAIKVLPHQRKSIFLLRTIADLSYQEIAKVLEIPMGTVMGELFRARKALRGMLTDYAREEGIIKREEGAHSDELEKD